jgi:hypothetical protein
MVWKLYTLGLRFHFLVETQLSINRIRIRETIDEFSKQDDLTKYGRLVACNNDARCVIQVKDTDLLIGIIRHDNNDTEPELRHSIELVDIINPKLL